MACVDPEYALGWPALGIVAVGTTLLSHHVPADG